MFTRISLHYCFLTWSWRRTCFVLHLHQKLFFILRRQKDEEKVQKKKNCKHSEMKEHSADNKSNWNRMNRAEKRISQASSQTGMIGNSLTHEINKKVWYCQDPWEAGKCLFSLWACQPLHYNRRAPDERWSRHGRENGARARRVSKPTGHVL